MILSLECRLMGRLVGSRWLVAIGAALVLLLGALAAVQYRWSTRVAAADAQREKEHLDSAALLFANEFNALVEEASAFVQNNARPALESGERVAAVPKIVGELYYVEIPARGNSQARRLAADGSFTPAPVPEWIAAARCSGFAVEQPPALVVPVYAIASAETRGPGGALMRRKTLRWQQGRCFVAQLDQAYLRGALFPELIRRQLRRDGGRGVRFRRSSARPAERSAVRLPGARGCDASRSSHCAAPSPLPKQPFTAGEPTRQTVFIQRMDADDENGPARLANLFGTGIWELHVAHKDVPCRLPSSGRGGLILLWSLAVECLLVAAIVLLVVGARRIERLADQKMRFVAGVSHELRSPVSAISMLSRNQADGLVAGPDRVSAPAS